ncbi:eEF1A lysine and N-terminal methyltransferase homolog [Condylostylus longicornis]|uniref:eEF1A lysine and N-terminal methyltransferase homolog n=1 Tax=Condylostylus longicornis TaxID=2530218 RepID=UPI00244D9CE3|nr:eEF1A lysine and N-terminal methyltransferase homolog [Condylostylus longicornis]
MNLLPKTHEEFSKSDYWNSFFKKRGEKSFEWYGEYLELCDILNKYIKPKDKILVVGCGNSKLSLDMYDTGYKEIINIDISHVVINQMLDLNRKTRPDMQFLQMDATKMTFPDEHFSVVLDKGTLDALMTSDEDSVVSIVQKYFEEICRVLRNGGRYVCISLLQEHIAKFAINFFQSHSCMLRVVRCVEAENIMSAQSSEMSFPIFALVVTKFKNLNQKVLEICMGGDKAQRVQSESQVLESIDSIQKTALIFNSLRKKALQDKNDELVIELCEVSTNKIRFTIYVVEQTPQRGNSKYGAFIVPQGREAEWLFSTKSGRKKLLNTAKHNRLAIVTLHRDQEYESLEKIQEELNSTLLNLKPNGMIEKIPYLSVGPDVGKRELVAKGNSQFSGEYRIEDVEYEGGKIYRRLVFMSNQNVIQSEALIQKIKRKNKEEKIINLDYLACEHHIYITIGINMATKFIQKRKVDDKILVVGLGGGGLCSFVHKTCDNIIIHAIEIDCEISNVAENYFGLKLDERMQVFIEDGLNFLKSCTTQYKIIIFDVDNKDLSLGMSCPPKEFVEKDVLNIVKKLIEPDGFFILNLVCRDEILRNEIITQLKEVFKHICTYKLEEEVNEIVFCTNQKDLFSMIDWRNKLERSCKELNNIIKKKKINNNSFENLVEFLNNLSIS